VDIAVRYCNGIGNTINLIPLLATIAKIQGKPCDLLPRLNKITHGAELIPKEYASVLTSHEIVYDAIIDPQSNWPLWSALNMHEVLFYLSFLTGKIADKYEIVDKITCNFDASWLPEKVKPRIILCNGFSKSSSYRWERKTWPFFSHLVDLLSRLMPDVEICKLGLPDELVDVGVIDYTNSDLSLLQSAGLISSADLVITNDTGLMHVADALNIPIVVLFGPTLANKNRPWQAPYAICKSSFPCAPCMGTTLWNNCTSYDCMKTISPADVVIKTFKLLQKVGKLDKLDIGDVLVNDQSICYPLSGNLASVPD